MNLFLEPITKILIQKVMAGIDVAYKQRANLTIQSVDDEILILDLNSDKIHQLNPTACFIWSKCDGTCDEKQLAVLLSDQYEVDMQTASSDVASILEQLQGLALIEIV